ncbi:hypothetical protein [Methanopyrus sp.]
MPIPKDYVEVSGHELLFKENLEDQTFPFYCLYLGAPFPDKLVMVPTEELAKHKVRYELRGYYVSEPKPLMLSFLKRVVEEFESLIDNPFPHSYIKNCALWEAIKNAPFVINGPVRVTVVNYGIGYVELEIEVPVNNNVTELTGTIEVKSGENVRTLNVTGSDAVNGVITKRVRLSQVSGTVEVTIQLTGVYRGRQVTDTYPAVITVPLVKVSGSANVTVEGITESEAVLRVEYRVNTENCSLKSVRVRLLKDSDVVASEERSQAEGTVRFTVNESGTYRVIVEGTVEWTTPSGRHEEELTLASQDVKITLPRLEPGAPSVEVSDYGADWAILTITVPVTVVGYEVTGGKVELIDAKTGHTLATTEVTVESGVLKATVKLTGLRGTGVPIIVHVVVEGKTPTGDSVTATAETSIEVRLAGAKLGGNVQVEGITTESATLRVRYYVRTENCTVESVIVELLKRTDQGWVVVDRRTLNIPNDTVTFPVSEEGQYKVRITAQCTHGVTMTTETEPVVVRLLPKVQISEFKVTETDYDSDWAELRITADVHVDRAENVNGLVVVEDAEGNVLGKFSVEVTGDHIDVKVRLEGLRGRPEEFPVVVKLRIEASNESGRSCDEVSTTISLKLRRTAVKPCARASPGTRASGTPSKPSTGNLGRATGRVTGSMVEKSSARESETRTTNVSGTTQVEIRDFRVTVEKVEPGRVVIDVAGRVEAKCCRPEVVLESTTVRWLNESPSGRRAATSRKRLRSQGFRWTIRDS